MNVGFFFGTGSLTESRTIEVVKDLSASFTQLEEPNQKNFFQPCATRKVFDHCARVAMPELTDLNDDEHHYYYHHCFSIQIQL